MTVTESTYRLLIYGPDMINVESDRVVRRDYDDLPKLRDSMVSLMRRCNGQGLAAAQIGVFKEFCIINCQQEGLICLVNPMIERMFGKEIEAPEGCLSLPPGGNECTVPRMESLIVHAATTEEPDVRRHFKFSGYTARIVQHELDHLTGTFFVDRVADGKRRIVLERFRAWKIGWEAAGKPFPY